MVSCRICGPKLSICCTLTSLWGIIMLSILGVLFYVRSPNLVEDLPIKEEDFEDYDKVIEAYHTNAYNCWIAAGLYVVTLAFSAVQFKLNNQASYTV
ncbi:PREDICTED: ribonuclease kappa-B-like [Priapulus caudatus]|uniref:Ribonuclease kappa-B-like n=1 Tax=Priapulus caudatus TaxID=37621 RepID=A0ABM1F475_PRICU|nr:PREDICTED: ribonuclease kappa-B-like [Priapulus caudatus]